VYGASLIRSAPVELDVIFEIAAIPRVSNSVHLANLVRFTMAKFIGGFYGQRSESRLNQNLAPMMVSPISKPGREEIFEIVEASMIPEPDAGQCASGFRPVVVPHECYEKAPLSWNSTISPHSSDTKAPHHRDESGPWRFRCGTRGTISVSAGMAAQTTRVWSSCRDGEFSQLQDLKIVPASL